jgi:hypothetical protein
MVFWAFSGADQKLPPKLQYNKLCTWLPASILLIAIAGGYHPFSMALFVESHTCWCWLPEGFSVIDDRILIFLKHNSRQIRLFSILFEIYFYLLGV